GAGDPTGLKRTKFSFKILFRRGFKHQLMRQPARQHKVERKPDRDVDLVLVARQGLASRPSGFCVRSISFLFIGFLVYRHVALSPPKLSARKPLSYSCPLLSGIHAPCSLA